MGDDVARTRRLTNVLRRPLARALGQTDRGYDRGEHEARGQDPDAGRPYSRGRVGTPTAPDLVGRSESFEGCRFRLFVASAVRDLLGDRVFHVFGELVQEPPPRPARARERGVELAHPRLTSRVHAPSSTARMLCEKSSQSRCLPSSARLPLAVSS
jgi:hypothetical protein